MEIIRGPHGQQALGIDPDGRRRPRRDRPEQIAIAVVRVRDKVIEQVRPYAAGFRRHLDIVREDAGRQGFRGGEEKGLLLEKYRRRQRVGDPDDDATRTNEVGRPRDGDEEVLVSLRRSRRVDGEAAVRIVDPGDDHILERRVRIFGEGGQDVGLGAAARDARIRLFLDNAWGVGHLLDFDDNAQGVTSKEPVLDNDAQ